MSRNHPVLVSEMYSRFFKAATQNLGNTLSIYVDIAYRLHLPLTSMHSPLYIDDLDTGRSLRPRPRQTESAGNPAPNGPDFSRHGNGAVLLRRLAETCFPTTRPS